MTTPEQDNLRFKLADNIAAGRFAQISRHYLSQNETAPPATEQPASFLGAAYITAGLQPPLSTVKNSLTNVNSANQEKCHNIGTSQTHPS